jgi:hypothetical protein
MTSRKRREARYQRRKAERAGKKQKLSLYDDFERVAGFDSLYGAFRKSMRGVS